MCSANPEAGYEMSMAWAWACRKWWTALLATPDQVHKISTYKLVYFRHGRSKVLYTTDRERGSQNPHWRPGKGGRQGRAKTERKKKTRKNSMAPGMVACTNEQDSCVHSPTLFFSAYIYYPTILSCSLPPPSTTNTTMHVQYSSCSSCASIRGVGTIDTWLGRAWLSLAKSGESDAGHRHGGSLGAIIRTTFARPMPPQVQCQ